jgi:hypothetical protein
MAKQRQAAFYKRQITKRRQEEGVDENGIDQEQGDLPEIQCQEDFESVAVVFIYMHQLWYGGSSQANGHHVLDGDVP